MCDNTVMNANDESVQHTLGAQVTNDDDDDDECHHIAHKVYQVDVSSHAPHLETLPHDVWMHVGSFIQPEETCGGVVFIDDPPREWGDVEDEYETVFNKRQCLLELPCIHLSAHTCACVVGVDTLPEIGMVDTDDQRDGLGGWDTHFALELHKKPDGSIVTINNNEDAYIHVGRVCAQTYHQLIWLTKQCAVHTASFVADCELLKEVSIDGASEGSPPVTMRIETICPSRGGGVESGLLEKYE